MWAQTADLIEADQKQKSDHAFPDFKQTTISPHMKPPSQSQYDLGGAQEPQVFAPNYADKLEPVPQPEEVPIPPAANESPEQTT